MDAHPFFDSVEADTVDLILITHFHIDHCAALPYFTEKTNFNVIHHFQTMCISQALGFGYMAYVN
jgi:Cft2 family RNA processing exonuclease